MSIDYSANTIVGFVIPVIEFFEDKLHVKKGKKKKEARYDSRTGKKIGDVTVQENDEVFVKLGKHKVETSLGSDGVRLAPSALDNAIEGWDVDMEVIEVLEEMLKCRVFCSGDHYNGYTFLCIEPNAPVKTQGVVLPSDLAGNAEEIDRIGKDIERLFNVDPGLGGVHSLLSVV